MDITLAHYWDELLAYGGIVLLIVGMKIIGDKKLSGFVVSIFARLMWAVWGLRINSTPIIAMSVIMVVVYFHNIYLWHKSDKIARELDNNY